MTPWLTIVGIGEDGLAGLSETARSLVGNAELLVGGARHLALVAVPGAALLQWASPLSQTLPAIESWRGRRVVVLASGDPMWYGVGAMLARHFDPAEMTVLPSPGAFSLAAARMAWPLESCRLVTLHGRPPDRLRRELAPGARLLILSENGATPVLVARLLAEEGWGGSPVTVLEHMGGPKERRIAGTATFWTDWTGADCADLNTIAVECRPDPAVRPHSSAPGLPDDAFLHDGQLTKREIRAATLAALAPMEGQMLWDVGAGCGSIAIEWLRAAPGAEAVAVERSPERCGLITRNAGRLGVPALRLVQGAAPEALAGLPPPDAVFLGGGLGSAGLLDRLYTALRPGGRLVANGVTLEGEMQLLDWQSRNGGALTRLSVARAERVGRYLAWKPLRPVTQLAMVKPAGGMP